VWSLLPLGIEGLYNFSCAWQTIVASPTNLSVRRAFLER
jgi:hypothetical protein